MLQTDKKILLFPVETTVRELDFRLILAVLCARPGWQILVGDHEYLFALSLRLKNVIQVLKNVTGGKRPWKYRRYKELGQRIIQLDEEGAIYEGNKDSWKAVLDKRLEVAQLDADDYVCTWGPFQADHYRSHTPACAQNIIVTGHPRLELGGTRFRELFKQEADSLRAKYGDFILFNTNLLSNNALGPDVLLRHYNIQPEDVENRSHRIEQYVHEAQREALFIRLINHLSNAFPGTRIVLRPHPSEDIRKYKSLLRYIPRVDITREGSLHAWLLATRVLIHGGCTTAIEAQLCGTPIINFHPIHDARFEVTLPNLLGVSCKTQEEVGCAVQSIMNGSEPPPTTAKDSEVLREMLVNFQADTDAFQLLADVIGKCQDEARPTELIGRTPPLLWHRVRDGLARFTRFTQHLRSIFHARDRGFDKFPPLDREEITRKLATIEKITGIRVNPVFHGSKILSITSVSPP